MRVKLVASMVAIAGGGIGLPLYLLKAPDNSGFTSQPKQTKVEPPQSPTKIKGAPKLVKSDSSKSFVKGACQVTSLEENWEKLLTSKSKNKSDYVSTSCKNTIVKNDYIELPVDWNLLLPKIFLKDAFTNTSSSVFEINTEVEQVEDLDTGNSKIIATFSGKGLKSSVTGIWDEVDQKQLPKKRVTSASIQKSEIGSGIVYMIFTPTF
ncbi:hypothetical protein [Mycoplasma ovis]|nr:hypothetical protein [Mycoplasma ovis]